MKKYLLDTNICVYYIKGLFQLEEKIRSVKLSNCFISEITIAELKFGIANSANSKKDNNRKIVTNFISSISIIPIISCLDFYATEKVRLRKNGTPIDDFDLLIGSTAVVNGITLVTNNEKHFARIEQLQIENWSKT